MMRWFAPDWACKKSCEEIPMLERVLPLSHSPVALGERLELYKPAGATTRLRDFIDRLLRLLRLLGEFIARGGPLS
jgi:hypothetical protein